MKTTRTRFAPSPTGYMHIGNLRTALYAYLLAKKNKGQFILRIEDTDQERYVPEALTFIYNTLKIAGLTHDEGPDIGGKYGPYTQSERMDIYKKYAEELISKGNAYYCFCSKERLDSLRAEAEKNNLPFKYDGHCKHLQEEEIKAKLNAGEPFVIRQKIPVNQEIVFNDLIFGELKANSDNLDEGILLKSNGLPTYNFANVIDDHLMEISHIIRGSEYISSTPKFILLYQAFGWKIPEHIHLPLILKDASKKFSKRDGDASFMDLLKRGYLKDAILNYIALLGWHPKDEQELFTLEELTKAFDINGLQKASAIFDIKKLNWFNAQYIKKLTDQEFHNLCLPYYDSLQELDYNLDYLSEVLRPRIEVFSEIPEKIDFLKKIPDYSLELFEKDKLKVTKQLSLQVLNLALSKLEEVKEWNEPSLKNALSDICKETNFTTGQVFWPARVALSGKEFTPGGATEIGTILGHGETMNRLNIAVNKLNS